MKTVELKHRPSKVVADGSAKVVCQTDTMMKFLSSLPDYLGGSDFKILVDVLRRAKREKKRIIWGCGGHVIKVGLTPVLKNLMEQGWVSNLAVNGAFAIHDFEMGVGGRTSEYVEMVKTGEFGQTKEIGMLNRMVHQTSFIQRGLGDTLARGFPSTSVLGTAWRLGIPVTVHIGIGTDVTIMHRETYSGEAWGQASSIDFERLRIFLSQNFDGGGVYLNIGSAVMLPEVFLKCIASLRAEGQKLDHFYTAVLDFIKMYRPLENVTRRPLGGRGKGFYLVGQHEILVPLLAACLVKK